MAYANRDNFVSRFGEGEIVPLEDFDNTGFPNEAASLLALSDATEEINTYIGVRYKLPLPNVPEPVVRACCDIARYRLYKDRPTEEVKYRYERTIKWLEQVGTGKAVLNFVPALTEVQQEQIKGPSVAIGTTYNAGVFNSSVFDSMPKI